LICPAIAARETAMSIIEQLLFAILGVTILAVSLALSDPQFGLVGALKGEAAVNQYSLNPAPTGETTTGRPVRPHPARRRRSSRARGLDTRRSLHLGSSRACASDLTRP